MTNLDGLPMCVCGLGHDGRIRDANDRCRQILGGDVIGRDWRDLFAASRQDAVAALWRAVTPEHVSGEFECLSPNGRRLRWHFSHMPPDGLWAIGIDVTEERAAQARRRDHERATALANLGAGLAHELRNPLNGAVLQLALAQRRLARAEQPVPGEIAAAARELHRAAALLEDFLVFARPQPIAHERAEVSAIVEGSLGQVRERAEEAGVRITTSDSPQVIAEVDPVRIERALVEALANAIDAAREAPTPEVTIRWTTESNSLVIEIEDRGPGLPSRNAPVFDPFYTTKPAGTGLGLAIVDRIVVDHGGTAELSRAGDATVFRMRLPIVLGAVS